MTEQQSGLNGDYDYSKNNRYALSGPGDNPDIDIVQCKVNLKRTSTGTAGRGSTISIQYDAEVFDYTGTSKGTASAKMPEKNSPLVVEGTNPSVSIWEGDTIESLDDKPNYQAGNIVWADDKMGVGGAYCSVGGVDGTHGTRSETCYFPCFVS